MWAVRVPLDCTRTSTAPAKHRKSRQRATTARRCDRSAAGYLPSIVLTAGSEG